MTDNIVARLAAKERQRNPEATYRAVYAAAAREAAEWLFSDWEAVAEAEDRRYSTTHSTDDPALRGRHQALAMAAPRFDQWHAEGLPVNLIRNALKQWSVNVDAWASDGCDKLDPPPVPVLPDAPAELFDAIKDLSARNARDQEKLIAIKLRAKYPSKADKSKAEPPTRITEPQVLIMSDIECKPVNWLWRNRVPMGCITVMAGRPGQGKSFVAYGMAANISTGADWPDGCACRTGQTLILSYEDDPAQVIRPRLDAMGANPANVLLLAGKRVLSEDSEPRDMLATLEDIDLLDQVLTEHPDIVLLTVDPAGSALGGAVDAHRDNEIRAVLAPLHALAERHQVAVVLVCHTRKAAAGHADDMVLGSRAFSGLARSVLHVMADPDDADRRLLLPGKMNLGKAAPGLAFRIQGDPPSIEWEPTTVDVSADDIAGGVHDGEEKSALDEAVDWLSHYLAEGARSGKDIKADAKKDGIAERTLKRAKSKLRVQSAPDGMGGPWVWYLPVASSVGQSLPSVGQENTLAHSDNTLAHSHECSPIDESQW